MPATSRRRAPIGLLALSAILLVAGCGGGDAGSDDDEVDEVTEATAPPARNDTRGTFADPLFDARDSVDDEANRMTEERKGDLDSAIEASEGASEQ